MSVNSQNEGVTKVTEASLLAKPNQQEEKPPWLNIGLVSCPQCKHPVMLTKGRGFE